MFATLGKATPAGFEPARGDPIGLAGRRLNHSAKVSDTEFLNCFFCVALRTPKIARPRTQDGMARELPTLYLVRSG